MLHGPDDFGLRRENLLNLARRAKAGQQVIRTVIPQRPIPMIELETKPGDERGFVHKRLIRGAIGLATGGPGAAVGGFFAPTTPEPPVRRPPPRTQTARPSAISAAEKNLGRALKLQITQRTDSCGPGVRRDRFGNCVDDPGLFPLVKRALGFPRGSQGFDPQRAAVGEAVMGRYGAALEPGSRVIDRAVCLRGMVLGNDGLCYNRSQITNKERMWPKGRRPLLTGGDMRAISTAARAGRRLEGATKRLQKIGLMKKPAPRKRITSGPSEHHHHN